MGLGYTLTVCGKRTTLAGPGPNYCSDYKRSVWLTIKNILFG